MNYSFPPGRRKRISRFCKILASASFAPETIVTNDDIISNNGLPFKSRVIVKSIGVEKRHVAMDHLTDSDILVESAQKCLEISGLSVDQLSRLIVNKYFGDNLLPMTASRLLGKLGSGTAVHAFDIEIYQVDPLVCPKCQGVMQIISFIEDQQVIRDILTHLELWLVRSRPPPACARTADRPKICAVTLSESKTSDSFAHTPHPQADYYADPEYSCDDYIQS